MDLRGLMFSMVDGINLSLSQTMQAKKIFCVSARKVLMSTTNLNPKPTTIQDTVA
jgi:hypothetical protein